MKYKKPTYEEYCDATRYAKVRYKFGVYIQLAALILFLFLLYYTITNIEEMKANPAEYAEEKLGITCGFPIKIQIEDYGSSRNIKNIGQG